MICQPILRVSTHLSFSKAGGQYERLPFRPPNPYIIENKHTKKTDTSRSVSVFVLRGENRGEGCLLYDVVL
jgi:hypothetical protein